MLETLETGELTKKEYERLLPELRLRLLNLQFDLRQADFSVVILIAGDDRGGCDEIIDTLHEWMDARLVETRFFGRATSEELERPRFWRFWRELPPDGKIGLFLGAWTIGAIAERLNDRLDDQGLENRIRHIQAFERELADDGTLLLKFWVHLPRKDLRKRLRRARKRPDRLVHVEDADWRLYEEYDDAVGLSERVIEQTSVEDRTWIVVDGRESREKNVAVARRIADAVESRLQSGAPEVVVPEPPAAVPDHLGQVDLAATVEPERYREKLKELQARLRRLTVKARAQGQSTVLVFEGWDAAGKGGTIRRLTRAMSARDYTVIPIAAPTEEEKARHYLWRFWRRLPRAGRMAIFDRSWYGRVLVERVEGFARDDQWGRAFDEIRDFEQQLTDHGIVVMKFWLHIDPDEQLRRFKDREKTPYKKYKITDEDYRNRDQWDAYVAAINEMTERTSTPKAPWHLVASNDKRHARLQVLQRVCKALKKAL